MRVLVACEFSGVVRDAFSSRGHLAMSCDLLPSETEGHHYQGDVRDLLTPRMINKQKWDLLIAHPPCTHLAVSGSRWFKYKQQEQIDALKFVVFLMKCNIPKICIENPVSVISSKIRKPDQIIQPYHFGDRERKTTCLWLKGLPKLRLTRIVEPDFAKDKQGNYYRDRLGRKITHTHAMSNSTNRGKDRSRTYRGIAEAMAEQWGSLILS